MNRQMLHPDPTESVAEGAARLGELLGLGKPVPDAVYLGALDDPEYARNLMLCRGAAPLLEFLFTQAPPLPEPASGTAAQAQSTLALVARASKSFWEWTRSGFATVDDETYRRRMEACLACPHHVEPPTKMLYKIVGTNEARDRICDLCGCVTSKKARLPHESCPGAHTDLPGLNRWGEPARARTAPEPQAAG